MGILKNKLFGNSQFDFKYFILWFMVTVYPLVVIPNSINYNALPRYVLLISFSFLALYILIREKIEVRHPGLLPLGLFFIFALISTILAQDKLMAVMGSPMRFTGFTTWISCFILFLLASAAPRKDSLLKCMTLCAALVSLLGVLQFFGFNLIPSNLKFGGVQSTIGNPNFFGTYTAFILPLSIFFFLNSRKPLWLACTAVIYAGFLVCLTRGVWLSLFISFIIIAVYVFKATNKQKPFIVIILAFTIVTCLLMPARDGKIFKRAFSISDQVSSAVQLDDKAGSGRMFIWKETIKLLPEYWAFGMGPDNLGEADVHTPSGKLVDKVHNIYLEVAITMGIFSLLSYLVFLAFFLKPGYGEQGFVFFIMIFTYLVQGFFNIDVVIVMPLFWIVLGLTLAYKKENGNFSFKKAGTIMPALK